MIKRLVFVSSLIRRISTVCRKRQSWPDHELLIHVLLALTAPLSAVAQAPSIRPQGLVNATTQLSSSSVPVATRGGMVSIFGNNFSTTTASAHTVPIPTELPGTTTQVLFGGILAPLLFVSPTQINVLVPFELLDSSLVDLVVRNENGESAPLKVTILTQDPAIVSV